MGIGGPVVLGRLGWWLVSARPRRIGQVGPSTCGCQSVSFKSALAKDQDEGDRPPPGWILSLYLHFYLLLLTLLTLFHYIKKTWNATSSSLSAILLYHLMYHDAFCCQTKTLNSPKCSKSILTIII